MREWLYFGSHSVFHKKQPEFCFFIANGRILYHKAPVSFVLIRSIWILVRAWFGSDGDDWAVLEALGDPALQLYPTIPMRTAEREISPYYKILLCIHILFLKSLCPFIFDHIRFSSGFFCITALTSIKMTPPEVATLPSSTAATSESFQVDFGVWAALCYFPNLDQGLYLGFSECQLVMIKINVAFTVYILLNCRPQRSTELFFQLTSLSRSVLSHTPNWENTGWGVFTRVWVVAVQVSHIVENPALGFLKSASLLS